LLLFGATPRAHAVNKDMVQLQTQVQQLQDAVARLQQTSDERWGVLKDLVQQTADSVNKMSAAVSGLQLKMQNVQDAAGQKNDQLSGQVQSLNDSLDELKARLDRIEKDLNSVQSSQQSTNALLGNLPGNVPPAGGAAAVPVGPANPTDSSGKPLPGTPLSSIANGTAPAPATLAPAASGNPPPGEMYRTAYPDDNLAGNGYYYIGEMDLRAGHYSAAIKDYDHVLEHYPDNSKTPAAHLHKGDALVALHQNEAG